MKIKQFNDLEVGYIHINFTKGRCLGYIRTLEDNTIVINPLHWFTNNKDYSELYIYKSELDTDRSEVKLQTVPKFIKRYPEYLL